MAYSRGPGVTCKGALTGNDGMGWVSIHRGVHVFFVFYLWVFRDGAVFYDVGFDFSFYDDYVFSLWCWHEQWLFAANVMILISQCNTCF